MSSLERERIYVQDRIYNAFEVGALPALTGLAIGNATEGRLGGVIGTACGLGAGVVISEIGSRFLNRREKKLNSK